METTKLPVKEMENGKSKLPSPRRNDPWTRFEQLWSDFDFDWDRLAMLRPRLPRLLHREEGAMQLWRPDIDVYQKDGDLCVKADLPGMKKEDVEVLLEDGKLVIKGERSEESKVEEDDYYRAERSYGSFYRSIPLPPEIEEDAIQAQFADGVLEVRVVLPQKDIPEPKRIAVE